jgi:transcriptional regulator with XRE-family HTH domain
VDDRRVGLVIRALRRRRRLRQVDLAASAGVSQSTVSRAELGHLDTVSLRQLRRLLAALDARLELEVRWRGGEIDRLADEGHARLAMEVAAEFRRRGWQVATEVTFTRFGERGSIDLLATRADVLAAAMVELKTEITSAEETQRRFDVKQRVLVSVVEEMFGWRPRMAAAILVVTDTSRNRRRIRILGSLLGIDEALGSRAVRRWVRAPSGSPSGVWFVRLTRPWGDKCRQSGSHRVRRPRSGCSTADTG